MKLPEFCTSRSVEWPVPDQVLSRGYGMYASLKICGQIGLQVAYIDDASWV